MGNCLKTPEPKSKRRGRPHRQRPATRPVVVAVPPDAMRMHPREYYPYPPVPQLYHQFAPEPPAGHVIPGLPLQHVLMIDPMTGQEFLVPVADHPFNDHHYFEEHNGEPAVYYSHRSNGVKPTRSRRLPDEHEKDEEEVDGGEGKEMKRKSREERKISQGHDNDKVDIRDAASFTTTAIVTATTSTSAPTTEVAAESTTSHHYEHISISPATAVGKEETVQIVETAGTVETVETVETVRTVETAGTVEIVETVETSRFEKYMGTPPPTPPLPPPPEVTSDQGDEDRDKDKAIIVVPPTFDDVDYSTTYSMLVSFAKEPDVIIPRSKFEMTEEKQEEEKEKEEEEESPSFVASQNVYPPIVFSKPASPVDVVITYSILAGMEIDIVRRLSSLLEAAGVSVWAERLGDSSRARRSDKTAKAILGSKVVVVILSEGSCHQRFIRDHVALATVINAPIYPVTTQPVPELIEAMPVELRLQLQNDPEEWTEIGTTNEYSLLFNLRSLARSVQEDIEHLRDKETGKEAKPIVRRISRQRSMSHKLKARPFWDVHFGHRHSVKWERMQKTVENEFSDQLKRLVDTQSQHLFLDGLKKKCCGEQDLNIVSRDRFTALCTIEGENIDVWEALLKVARSEQAVRDIFDTESTVRHLVLDNPGEMMSFRM